MNLKKKLITSTKPNSQKELMKVIIMAGGQGTRLWPKSSMACPKQFNSFFSKETLIEKTYQRALSLVPTKNIFISIYQKHKPLLTKIIPSLRKKNIIVEPMPKETTSAILFASLNQQFRNDDILFFLPSDHIIQNNTAFKQCVSKAFKVTYKTNKATLFGIKPTFSADCYGYIKIKKFTPDKNEFIIEKFIEKPTLKKARELVAKKNYFWNSGMFLFSKKTILKLAESHTPDHLEKINKYYKLIQSNPTQARNNFKKLKKISFDYAIMEKIKNMNCLLANFIWNDIGNWNAIFKLSKKDKNGNTISKNVQFFSSYNNLVEVENKKFNLVINGIKNIFIIQNGKDIYITSKEKEKEIKNIVNKLKLNKRKGS